MAKPKKNPKRTNDLHPAERRRVRSVWGSAIGAAFGSLAGGAFAHNPELLSQSALALKLQFEPMLRAREQADVLHFLGHMLDNLSKEDTARPIFSVAIESIKAGMHVGTAEVDHASIFEDFLSKMNPIPQAEWVRTDPPPPEKPTRRYPKGRKS